MKFKRLVALPLAGIGLIMTVAGPVLPGGERLTRVGLPSDEHVIALAPGADGALLAGTQAGTVWRYRAGRWQPLKIDLGGHPVTALIGEPQRVPVGTAGGLFHPPRGLTLADPVADLLDTEHEFIVATRDGLRILGGHGWRRINAGLNVYRLARQQRDGRTWLHAGTIGGGVHSSALEASAADWPANNAGLPAGAVVYSLAVTASGHLLAGTRAQGLFWQGSPGQLWQPLDAGLDGKRLLSLHLEPARRDATQRLWIGADRELLALDLNDTPERLTLASAARSIPQAALELRHGVSWIRPIEGAIMLSAGDIYRWGPTRVSGWYWVSLAGVGLLLLGGFLLPGRPAPA